MEYLAAVFPCCAAPVFTRRSHAVVNALKEWIHNSEGVDRLAVLQVFGV